MSEQAALILGWRAPELTRDARLFFSAVRPWGFILFQEACQTPDQVRGLVASLQAAAGHRALVFLDQEGGRVARLRPPHWPVFPPAAAYSRLFRRNPSVGVEACRLGHRLIAHELRLLGVGANCAPVLDLPAEEADPVIGDRAFGDDARTATPLARAAMEGLHAGGVASVIKHIPGHGRAPVDSHKALPRVSADPEALAVDFEPFRALAPLAPIAMTAHVVYDAFDRERPATTSARVVREVIRTQIGFDGLLITDDIAMGALEGPWSERTSNCFAAGVDMVLHCSGDIDEMEQVAIAAPLLAGRSLARAEAARAIAQAPVRPFDPIAAYEAWQALLGSERGAAA